jgi:hypothetical protein
LVKPRIFNGLLCVLFFAVSCSYAVAARVVVVYQTPDPSQEQVYSAVLNGIENKLKTIVKLELSPSTSDLQSQLDSYHPLRVIALDRSVANLVNKTSYKNKLLAGLFSFEANQFSGLSLSLDNRAVAAKLTHFIPSIGRLFIVQQKGFQTIKDSLVKNDKTSKVKMVNGGDSLATIRLLSNLLEHEATPSDAVFIPPNLPDDILFKIGLAAWDIKIKLFSTNMWHLENGALIVFYPDTIAMGEQLGMMVDKKLPAYETVDAIATGLNRRLAQHHGVDFEPSVQGQFTVKIK